ncbi:hypothetical protein QN277_005777 [Acacia crassicarpa]|uniref:Uncharacterized protein n=1 Tax=Acacia crassicarpa TaxID=499986 RepID=A0AAE1MEL2_9FABA|nr:hypothetical protein QN277_005777 [Acacia crassicarpa]
MLQFNIISEEPFVVHGLKITPLPVWHGQGYRSLGFRFGNVCYIRDECNQDGDISFSNQARKSFRSQ